MISASMNFTVIPLLFSDPFKIILSKQNKEPLILENSGFSFNFLHHKVLEIEIADEIIGQYNVVILDVSDRVIYNGVVEFRADLEEIESLQKNEKTTVQLGRYKIKR